MLQRCIVRVTFLASVILFFLMLLFPRATFSNPVPDGVIAQENLKPGTTSWMLTSPATNREIEGYASLTSVNRGGQINLFVNTTNSTYLVEVFRVGWYGGTGAREMLGPLSIPGCIQAIPARDPVSGLIECNWTNPFSLKIPATADPTDWASGVYLARLTGGQDGKQSYIIFAVRDDARPTDLLVQMSFSTYEAYNNWGGASLYGFNSTPAPAKKVSFNRPFASGSSPWEAAWMGSGHFITSPTTPAWEWNLVHWLEREGYDVSYCTSVDVHSITNLLLNHKGFISMGHDEYWSYPMRWKVQAARDQGVNLAFLSSNTCYWQVRFEPSVVGGAENRTMVCYKDLTDPVSNTLSNMLTTVNFRAPPVNDPESSLLGVNFIWAGVSEDMVVGDTNHWIFSNCNLTAGQILPGLVGYEVDVTNGFSPTNIWVACSSPYTLSDTAGNQHVFHSHAASYTAPSGATVFASGSMQWSWGLDDLDPQSNRPQFQNPAVQQITRNILARLANLPTPSPTLFFHTDFHSRGNWKSCYGADGFILPNDSTNLPTYCSFDAGMALATTHLASSSDVNSLQNSDSSGRYLAGWSSPTNFTMDLNLSDGMNHQIALYFWDWNNAGRTQLVEVLDGTGTNLLDHRTVSSFTNGQWWVWQVNGHVQFRITNLSGPDCLVNALTLGLGAAATFVGEDADTRGDWKTYYGADGAFMAGYAPHNPAYGDVNFGFGGPPGVLQGSATIADPRALQIPGSTNRALAAWIGGLISFHLNLTDNAWHKLSIYCVDPDQIGRQQSVSLFDPATQTMLDSQKVTNFGGGKYLVWNVRGALDVRVQDLGPNSLAVSGLFLDPYNQLPAITLASPKDNQILDLPTNIVLVADATNSGGFVGQVNFYADGVLLGIATNAPFALTWSNALVGQHTLTALAVVSPTARKLSKPIGILVDFATNSAAHFIGISLLSNKTAQLDAFAPLGKSLRLEVSESLNVNAVWMPLMTNSSTDNLFRFIVTDPMHYPQRFYRVVTPP